MKSLVLFLAFLFPYLFFCQNFLDGRVVEQNSVPLPGVVVANINSGKLTTTDRNGNFRIAADNGDEIRFATDNYYRVAIKVATTNNSIPYQVILEKIPIAIQEIELGFKPSGDLQKDSRSLTKVDKTEILQKEIGVPKPPEKPREVPPPDIKKVGALAFALSNLNLNNLYKNISGDARRMRNLYKYEDLQSNIEWVRKRLDNNYFIEAGLPKEKISEFLQFSFSAKPEIVSYIKTKNLSKVMLKLEETLPIYLERLKVNKS